MTDIEEDGILGMYSLGEAVIDCKQRTLSIGNELIPLVGEPMPGTERKCFRKWSTKLSRSRREARPGLEEL